MVQAQITVPEQRSRNRIAVIGPSGTGKTTGILMLLRGLISKTGARVIWIEGDDGMTKCLDEFPDLKALLGTYIFKLPVARTWNDFYGANKGAGQAEEWVNKGQLGPNDWVVTEGLDILTTETIRSEFITRAVVAPAARKAKNKELTSWDVLLDERANERPAIDQSDWGAINSEVEKACNFLGFLMPCNWIATTDIMPMSQAEGGRGDSQVLKDIYLSMGMDVKMTGYKWLPRYFDTIVRTGRSMSAGYNFIVYKNRGQRARIAESGKAGQLVTEPNDDFYVRFGQKYLGLP